MKNLNHGIPWTDASRWAPICELDREIWAARMLGLLQDRDNGSRYDEVTCTSGDSLVVVTRSRPLDQSNVYEVMDCLIRRTQYMVESDGTVSPLKM